MRSLIGILAVGLLPATLSAQPINFDQAKRILRAAIDDGAFPGCSVAVGNSADCLWTEGFGHFTYDNATAAEIGFESNPAVTSTTIYDLASLTKVVGTTSVIMALIRDELLSVDVRIDKLLPDFRDNTSDGRDRVTVRHLLTHTSGLPAWRPFYRTHTGYDPIVQAASITPLTTEPATKYVYSDLGFMLLAAAAERAGGMSIPQLESRLIFQPLGMHDTQRNPPTSQRTRIPPTERDPATRTLRHAVVHDENAQAAQGLTGHAGLFSTAPDLSKLATELLNAYHGRSRLFPQELTQQFCRRANIVAGSSRALGWDTPSGRSSGGDLISSKAIGHTGFTGTSLWIDFERDAYLILLTNRVHPSRQNHRISGVRRDFANAVLTAVDSSK